MRISANVLSVEALEDLEAGLVRFVGEAQEALQAAAHEIRRTLDWLAERGRYWQSEVRRRVEICEKAKAQLTACRSRLICNDYGCSEPPCTAEWETMRKAQVYLEVAQAELRTVQQWMKLTEQAAADYERQAQRLAGYLKSELPRATALLGRKVSMLHEYTMMSPSSGGVSTSARSDTYTTTASEAGDAEIAGGLGVAALGAAALAGQPTQSTSGSTEHLREIPLGEMPERRFADQSFKDREGRDLVLSSHRLDSNIDFSTFNLSVHDQGKITNGRQQTSPALAAKADIRLEGDLNVHIRRVQLVYIETFSSYQEAGIGDALLEQVEAIAGAYGAEEIYGTAPGGEREREWYSHRGYEFRNNGLVVYKRLRF